MSDAVRQCRASYPAGRAADDAEGTKGWRVAAEGEKATGQGKGAAARVQAGETKGVAHVETDEKASGQRNVPRIPVQLDTGEKDRRRGDADAARATKDGEGELGDVPGYVPTPEDLRLWEVYGDWVHGNPGTHLDGGIAEDGKW